MKYNKDDILYFKPSYNENIKYCRVCQVVKYLEKTKQYLVIASDIYCPSHYNKCYVYEDDLDNLTNTFLYKEIDIKDVYMNLPINEVLKLQYYDIYTEIKKDH